MNKEVRNQVSVSEPCRQMVDGIDANVVNRVSIKTIMQRGVSKEGECTMLVGRGETAMIDKTMMKKMWFQKSKETGIVQCTILSWLRGRFCFSRGCCRKNEAMPETFLGAPKHPYNWLCQSVGWSDGR